MDGEYGEGVFGVRGDGGVALGRRGGFCIAFRLEFTSSGWPWLSACYELHQPYIPAYLSARDI